MHPRNSFFTGNEGVYLCSVSVHMYIYKHMRMQGHYYKPTANHSAKLPCAAIPSETSGGSDKLVGTDITFNAITHKADMSAIKMYHVGPC